MNTLEWNAEEIVEPSIPFQSRYDSGRARYLVRERDPSPGPGFLEPRNDAVWTDYVGDGPYAERFIDRDTGEAQDRASFVPGIAQRDESAQPPTAVGRPWRPAEQPLYFHGDQIGTSRVLTDGAGLPARRVVYTAFGEPVFSEPPAQAGGLTRYLYAGAWGYETFNDAAFPFLHVGERWYDPATGRFLQRDPIGIEGDLNVYTYAGNCPIDMIDPEGLESCAERMWRMHDRAIMEGRYDDARDIRIGMAGGAAVGVGLVAVGGAAYAGGPALVGVGRTGVSSVAAAAASRSGIQQRVGNLCLVIRVRFKEASWELQKLTLNIINRTSGNRAGIGYDDKKGWHIDRKGR